ncbi:hypothetical protein C4568_02720 [Candidatus Parcubacteria bacterium]|nr:MAG: hypothetical protein C4568_02720 [Candidatus Parcubacteria bacterium]
MHATYEYEVSVFHIKARSTRMFMWTTCPLALRAHQITLVPKSRAGIFEARDKSETEACLPAR